MQYQRHYIWLILILQPTVPTITKSEDYMKEANHFFGIGPCHPKFLQIFASKKFFTFILCTFAFVEGALVSGKLLSMSISCTKVPVSCLSVQFHSHPVAMSGCKAMECIAAQFNWFNSFSVRFYIYYRVYIL